MKTKHGNTTTTPGAASFFAPFGYSGGSAATDTTPDDTTDGTADTTDKFTDKATSVGGSILDLFGSKFTEILTAVRFIPGLNDIKKLFQSEFEQALAKALKADTESVSSSAPPSDDLYHLTSIADVVRHFDLGSVDGTVWCRCCTGDAYTKKLLDDDCISRYGVFTTNQELKNLKQSLAHHVKNSARHQLNIAAAAAQQKFETDSMAISLRVGTLALNNFLESNSYLCFERQVAMMHLAGANIGTINHSTDFISTIRTAFYDEAIDRISSWLHTADPSTGQQRLFSVVSDKMTENGRTGHLVGIIVMVDGEMKGLLVAHKLCDDGTGVGLAKNLKEALSVLELTTEDYKTCNTGGGWDGQYFCLGTVVSRAVLRNDIRAADNVHSSIPRSCTQIRIGPW
jgi:hypothetical protein